MTINAIPSQGYRINYSKQNSFIENGYNHIFCGSHTVIGAWCENCNKVLLRFLSVDTNDSRLQLQNLQIQNLSLFYCWTCVLSYAPFFYQIKDDSIEIIEYRAGESFKDHPYENYPLFFPKRLITLSEISLKEQLIIHSLNNSEIVSKEVLLEYPDLNRNQHQIGGEPLLMQPDVDLLCPNCKQDMHIFASIVDRNSTAVGFTGYKDVQVIFSICHRCKIVGAVNRCE